MRNNVSSSCLLHGCQMSNYSMTANNALERSVAHHGFAPRRGRSLA